MAIFSDYWNKSVQSTASSSSISKKDKAKEEESNEVESQQGDTEVVPHKPAIDESVEDFVSRYASENAITKTQAKYEVLVKLGEPEEREEKIEKKKKEIEKIEDKIESFSNFGWLRSTSSVKHLQEQLNTLQSELATLLSDNDLYDEVKNLDTSIVSRVSYSDYSSEENSGMIDEDGNYAETLPANYKPKNDKEEAIIATLYEKAEVDGEEKLVLSKYAEELRDADGNVTEETVDKLDFNGNGNIGKGELQRFVDLCDALEYIQDKFQQDEDAAYKNVTEPVTIESIENDDELTDSQKEVILTMLDNIGQLSNDGEGFIGFNAFGVALMNANGKDNKLSALEVYSMDLDVDGRVTEEEIQECQQSILADYKEMVAPNLALMLNNPGAMTFTDPVLQALVMQQVDLLATEFMDVTEDEDGNVSFVPNEYGQQLLDEDGKWDAEKLKALDKNEDGLISQMEIDALKEDVDGVAPQTKIEAAVDLINQALEGDEDLEIAKRYLKQFNLLYNMLCILDNMSNLALNAFGEIFADEDGKLSAEKLAEADINGDGELTEAELTSYLQNVSASEETEDTEEVEETPPVAEPVAVAPVSWSDFKSHNDINQGVNRINNYLEGKAPTVRTEGLTQKAAKQVTIFNNNLLSPNEETGVSQLNKYGLALLAEDGITISPEKAIELDVSKDDAVSADEMIAFKNNVDTGATDSIYDFDEQGRITTQTSTVFGEDGSLVRGYLYSNTYHEDETITQVITETDYVANTAAVSARNYDSTGVEIIPAAPAPEETATTVDEVEKKIEEEVV